MKMIYSILQRASEEDQWVYSNWNVTIITNKRILVQIKLVYKKEIHIHYWIKKATNE